MANAAGFSSNVALNGGLPAGGMQVTVQRVENPPAPVILGAGLSDGTFNERRLTQDQIDRIGQARERLKEQLRLDQGSTDFTVHLYDAEKCVTWYSPDGHRLSRDLKREFASNPALEKAYNEVFDLASEAWGMQIQCTNAKSSTQALEQSSQNKIVKDLPRTHFSTAAKAALELYNTTTTTHNPTQAQKDQALKRIVAAEKNIHWNQQTLVELNNQLQPLIVRQQTPGAAPDPTRDQQIKQLRHQIEQLERMRMDRIATYLALAFFPADPNPTSQDVAEAAENAKLHLEKIAEERRKKENGGVMNNLRRYIYIPFIKSPEEIPEDKNYFGQVAAIMFSALPHRIDAQNGYENFCRKHSLTQAECRENSMMRFIAQTEALPILPPRSGPVPLLERLSDAIEAAVPAGHQQKGAFNDAMRDFDVRGLQTLLNDNTITMSRENRERCLTALLDLRKIDFVQVVSGLDDVDARKRYMQQLSEAHNILHGPAMAPGSGSNTLEAQLDQIQKDQRFTPPPPPPPPPPMRT